MHVLMSFDEIFGLLAWLVLLDKWSHGERGSLNAPPPYSGRGAGNEIRGTVSPGRPPLFRAAPADTYNGYVNQTYLLLALRLFPRSA